MTKPETENSKVTVHEFTEPMVVLNIGYAQQPTFIPACDYYACLKLDEAESQLRYAESPATYFAAQEVLRCAKKHLRGNVKRTLSVACLLKIMGEPFDAS